MIKGKYVALLSIDIHIDRKDVTFEEVEDSINGNFTEELRNAIADNFVANDVDITLTRQSANLYKRYEVI